MFCANISRIITIPEILLILLIFSLDHGNYQLGTLSHIINNKASGYQELPDWPEVAPNPLVRNVEVVMPWADAKETKVKKSRKGAKKMSFYSDADTSMYNINVIIL